jgi:hypothetical protein
MVRIVLLAVAVAWATMPLWRHGDHGGMEERLDRYLGKA